MSLLIILSILGPNKSRGCTDVICCIVYLAFIGFWFAIGAVAFQNGDPTKILLPTDSSGNLCGAGLNIDKPYLMYFDVTKCTSLDGLVTSNLQCPTYQTCVATCPDSYWSYYTNALPIIAAYAQSLALQPNTPFSTIVCADDNINPACIELDAFVCKPQFQSRLDDMVSGDIPPADVLTTFTRLIGKCHIYR